VLKNYKELKVWQKSYRLCLEIYRISSKFPKEERYGLTSQIRRSVVSVPSNIAEGYGRKTTLDYIRMLYISYGSVCELETQILLAGDLDLIEEGELGKLKKDVEETERMLKALIKSLKNKPLNPGILGPFSPTKLEKNLFYFEMELMATHMVIS
jgi:four helix bundle protein